MRQRFNRSAICSSENYCTSRKAHFDWLNTRDMNYIHSCETKAHNTKVYGYMIFGELKIIKTKEELNIAIKGQFKLIEL